MLKFVSFENIWLTFFLFFLEKRANSIYFLVQSSLYNACSFVKKLLKVSSLHYSFCLIFIQDCQLIFFILFLFFWRFLSICLRCHRSRLIRLLLCLNKSYILWPPQYRLKFFIFLIWILLLCSLCVNRESLHLNFPLNCIQFWLKLYQNWKIITLGWIESSMTCVAIFSSWRGFLSPIC